LILKKSNPKTSKRRNGLMVLLDEERNSKEVDWVDGAFGQRYELQRGKYDLRGGRAGPMYLGALGKILVLCLFFLIFK
jgi:hypothetical protein